MSKMKGSTFVFRLDLVIVFRLLDLNSFLDVYKVSNLFLQLSYRLLAVTRSHDFEIILYVISFRLPGSLTSFGLGRLK